MTTGIIDYGMGNLASVRNALTELGETARIIDNPADLKDATRIILPGVGAFAQAMENLQVRGWVDALKDMLSRYDIPLLGICLGMQLLADLGTENGDTPGLGYIPGSIKKLSVDGDNNLRLPHVGWNEIHIRNHDDPLLRDVADSADFYFVHSYGYSGVVPAHILAETTYGTVFPSIVGNANIRGTQFHPEKSGQSGFKILQNFLHL